jgi:3-hydroxyacyl-[acyl-carrier-protein] dehydratase
MNLEYFQLIDRIVDLSLPERRITVEARVPETSTIFEGHFPGHPLMPGVLLIESMAQSSGWLVIAAGGFKQMPFLAQVKEAKLRTFVSPGALLRLDAELIHEGSGFAVTKVKVTQDGKPICNSELVFRVVDFPNDEMRGKMRETAERIAFPMGMINA